MVMSIEGLDPRRERLVLAYFCRGKFCITDNTTMSASDFMIC
jgi:hypothetical protein